jgi:hypothetical protein
MPENKTPTPNRSFEPTALGKPRSAAQLQRWVAFEDMVAQPPQPRIIIAEPSVKSLFIELRFGGQALGTGTGFVANASRGPVLITNRHNATGRHQETGQPLSRTGAVPDQFAILHNRANLLGQWVPRVEALYANGQPLWLEHPALGARAASAGSYTNKGIARNSRCEILFRG